MSPHFENILAFYKVWDELIKTTPKNEWAGDAYSWSEVIHMTPIEANFWEHLRAAGGVMYPQYPVAGFFVDFANPVAKVIVECDGKAFHTDKAKDAARDEKLALLGWTVYRLTGRQCNGDFDEETGYAGFTREFIDALILDHRIKRTNKSKLPITESQMFRLSAEQLLMGYTKECR